MYTTGSDTGYVYSLHTFSTAIVPMQCICCSCLLIPPYDMKIDLTLSADNSLDCCHRFYVSNFLDLYMYQFFND
jgi:hypothetical protein